MAFSTMNIARMGRRGVNLAALNLGVAAYRNGITRKAYNFAATAIGKIVGGIPGYRLETTRERLKIVESVKIERSYQLGKIDENSIYSYFESISKGGYGSHNVLAFYLAQNFAPYRQLCPQIPVFEPTILTSFLQLYGSNLLM